MSPALWTGVLVTLAILAILAARPVLFRIADRHRWRREHKNHKETG
jgi:nucleoside recognition membrane protein YjiH